MPKRSQLSRHAPLLAAGLAQILSVIVGIALLRSDVERLSMDLGRAIARIEEQDARIRAVEIDLARRRKDP